MSRVSLLLGLLGLGAAGCSDEKRSEPAAPDGGATNSPDANPPDAGTVSEVAAPSENAPICKDEYYQVEEGKLLSFQVEGSDPNGDSIQYFSRGLPQGASLSPSGLFHWQPSYDQAGTYHVRFFIQDADGIGSCETTIFVEDTAPFQGGITFAHQIIMEKDRLVLSLPDKDSNGNEISWGVDRNTLPRDAQYINQTHEFQWVPDYDQSGEYQVLFQAQIDIDAMRSTVDATLPITVLNKNRAPVFQPENCDRVNMLENEWISIPLTATDPDGDPVQIEVVRLPEGAVYEEEKIQWQPSFDQTGHYFAHFVADDGEDQTHKICNFIVDNNNRPPVFLLEDSYELRKNELFELNAIAEDPDGGRPNIFSNNLPRGATLRDGIFHWQPGADQSGEYSVTFVANDVQFRLQVEKTVTFTVVNRRPALDIEDDYELREGQRFELPINASDPDGDPLQLSARNLPAGATLVNGVFAWEPAHNQSGDYRVVFVADDGDNRVEKTVLFHVMDVNGSPVLNVQDSYRLRENQNFEIRLNPTDPEGDPIQLSVRNLPPGSTFDNNIFHWQPDFDQAGNYTVTFIAEDGLNHVERDVNLLVENVDRGPLFNLPLTDSYRIEAGQLLEIPFEAYDPDGDPVNLRVYDFSPAFDAAANFDGTVFRWTPADDHVGQHTLVCEATANGQLTSKWIHIEVVELNEFAPEITVSRDTQELSRHNDRSNHVYESEWMTLTLRATDVEGDITRLDVEAVPEGAFITRNFANNGLVEIQWSPDCLQAGAHSLIVTAEDDGEPHLTTQQEFAIEVEEACRPEVWTKVYPTPAGWQNASASGLATDINGNLYLVGNLIRDDGHNGQLVQKMDPDGNILWSHIQEHRGDLTGEDLIVDRGDNVYVSGSSNGDLWLQKLNQNDRVVWQSWFFKHQGILNSENTIHDLELGPQGEIYAYGITDAIPDSPNNPASLWLGKFDADGRELWTHTEGQGVEWIHDFAVNAQGESYGTAGEFLCSWDSMGIFTECGNQFVDYQQYAFAAALGFDQSNNRYLFGVRDGAAFLSKQDENRQILWTQDYRSPEDQEFPTSEGGVKGPIVSGGGDVFLNGWYRWEDLGRDDRSSYTSFLLHANELGEQVQLELRRGHIVQTEEEKEEIGLKIQEQYKGLALDSQNNLYGVGTLARAVGGSHAKIFVRKILSLNE